MLKLYGLFAGHSNKTCSHRKNNFLFYGMCLISLLIFTSNSLAVKSTNSWSSRNSVTIHIKDTGTSISKKLKLQQLVRKGSASRFSSITVETGQNTKGRQGDVASFAFEKYNLFQKKTLKIKPFSRISLQCPIIKDEIYELKDSLGMPLSSI